MTTTRDSIVAAVAGAATIGSVFAAAFVAAWGWNFGQAVWSRLF